MAEMLGNHYDTALDQKNGIQEQQEKTQAPRSAEGEKIAKRNGDISTALKNNHPVDKILKIYYPEGFSSSKLNKTDVETWLPEICSRMKDDDPALNLENISDTHLSTLLQNLAKKAPQTGTHPKLLLPTVDCSKEKDNFSALSDLLADASAKGFHLQLNNIHGIKIAGKYFDEKSKKYGSEVYSTPSAGTKISHKVHVIESTDYALWEKILDKSPNKKITINSHASYGSTLLEDPLSGDMIILNNEKGVAEFFDKNNSTQVSQLDPAQKDYLRNSNNTDIATRL